jgi:site-specific DNA recombinase
MNRLDEDGELIKHGLAAVTVEGDPRLVEAQERIRLAERRLTEISDELAALAGELINESEVTSALHGFDKLWDALAPREQARIVEMLIERVSYDGRAGNLSITYRPIGIRSLAAQSTDSTQDAA